MEFKKVDIKTVMVPTDLSENAEYALLFAKSVAEKLGARLIVYHCLTDIDKSIGYVPGFPCEQIEKSMRDEAMKELTILKNRYQLGSDVEIVVEKGEAYRKIVDFAQSHHADLIIIGARGKTKLEKFIFGSVTQKVVRISDIPLLVVKIPKE
jgi:nucleotide-binding universal stress UspA family protein